MVEFTFNADEHQPWRGDETPIEAARRMWFAATVLAVEIDNPAEAIERAAWDAATWQALLNWAKAQDSLSDQWKAALHDLWLHGCPEPPRKNKDLPTEVRDAILRRIGHRLCEEHGLNKTQTTPGPTVECAASVLAELPGTPAEGEIANILTRRS